MLSFLGFREIAGVGHFVLDGLEALGSEAVLEAEQFPAGAAELNPSLANVQRDNLSHLIAAHQRQGLKPASGVRIYSLITRQKKGRRRAVKRQAHA